MALIKNNSFGVRIINVKVGDTFTQRAIGPGESVDTDDVDLFDPANPVYRGWAESGDLEFPKGLLPEASKKKRGEPAPAQPIAPTPAPGGPGAPPTQSDPASKPGG